MAEKSCENCGKTPYNQAEKNAKHASSRWCSYAAANHCISGGKHWRPEVEKCVECGVEIPNIKAPKEITGSLICKKCAEKEGLPTLMSQLGLRLKCEEEKE